MSRYQTNGKGQEQDQGSGVLPGAGELGRGRQLKHTHISLFDGQVTAFPELEQVKTAPVTQVVDEDFEDGFPNAGMLPAMEPLVTDLPGRGLGGDIVPGQAGGKLPENILENEAVVERWAAAGGGRKKGLEEEPLGVGEKHRVQLRNFWRKTKKVTGKDYLIKKQKNRRGTIQGGGEGSGLGREEKEVAR
jgi:hypothetical protein